MDLQAVVGKLTAPGADAIVVGIYEDAGLDPVASGLDALLGGELSRLVAAGAWPGRKGLVHVLHGAPALAGTRVAAVGLGPQAQVSLEVIRLVTAAAVRKLREEGVRSLSSAVHGAGVLEPTQAVESIVEGAILGSYRFNTYKRLDEAPPELDLLTLTIADATSLEAVRRGIEVGRIRAEATCTARDLVNTPPTDLRPAELVETARTIAEVTGLTCTVLGDAELTELGANLILAVNRASDEEAALIILEHRGGPEDQPPVGLVGKAVCFDTGGLSLKSGTGMMTMKCDMGGAAAVLGAIGAIARLGLKRNFTAVIPAVQNLVGPQAVKPGDIVTGLGGKSVEILNTDAEGRLILADALAYAVDTLGCRPVIDIATLTGACMRALGPFYGGCFSPQVELLDRVQAVGLQAGEKFWPMPLDEEYADQMKSDVADLRNISTHTCGGASSAAEFLHAFVGQTPWVHLDIAGLALPEGEKPHQPKGASGFGVRTLINLAISLAKESAA